MTRAWILAAALCLFGCADRVSTPAAEAGGKQPEARQNVAATSQHELGRRIYNFRCYFCHGYSGDAKTLASTYLNPRPRDFKNTAPEALSRERMLEAVTNGRPGTAMKGFKSVLNAQEVAAVTDFVRQEFMTAKAVNTLYHTPENGWYDHQRNAIAYPFAKGEIPLDTPWQDLTPEQQAGKKLFLATCVTCHDRAKVKDEGAPWEGRPLSYPRNNYSPADPPVDATASASVYAIHDRPPPIADLTPAERRGEKLFQGNCAFCHAADGTAKNWIGSFLEPHPRDLTGPVMDSMTRGRLRHTIREGLPDTSMPAWKSVLNDREIQDIIAYISRAFHPIPDKP